jgi:hypothetical protein
VALTVGEPLEVPEDMADDRLEPLRLELERRLTALERRALALLEKSDPV